MKAFILAAGLGTRLRPWTLEHPKALVPVGGMPMLERVILRMRDQGFDDITVNVHHFAGQIVDFLNTRDFGVSIHVSDERERLLDTGGAILHASRFLAADPAPFLVHNVDILSDAPLASLMQKHIGSGRDISLVTSERKSSRRLLFDADGTLAGWHSLATDEYRPEGFCRHAEDGLAENAFSGIYVVSANAVDSGICRQNRVFLFSADGLSDAASAKSRYRRDQARQPESHRHRKTGDSRTRRKSLVGQVIGL